MENSTHAHNRLKTYAIEFIRAFIKDGDLRNNKKLDLSTIIALIRCIAHEKVQACIGDSIGILNKAQFKAESEQIERQWHSLELIDGRSIIDFCRRSLSWSAAPQLMSSSYKSTSKRRCQLANTAVVGALMEDWIRQPEANEVLLQLYSST